ncbi:MAG: helix-turn-helix transcriptional regulator [Desulfomonilaceae bacterium]
MDKLLRTREMSELIGIKPETLLQWLRQRPDMPHIRPTAKSVRFRPAELLAWLQEQTRKEEPCNS